MSTYRNEYVISLFGKKTVKTTPRVFLTDGNIVYFNLFLIMFNSAKTVLRRLICMIMWS